MWKNDYAQSLVKVKDTFIFLLFHLNITFPSLFFQLEAKFFRPPSYISLFSSHCESVSCKICNDILDTIETLYEESLYQLSELWSLGASYEGTGDMFHTPSTRDQRGPKLYCTNFSAHTVSQDEHQSL